MAGLAFTAGCGGTEATTPAAAAPTTAPALPKCSDLFKPGQKINQAKASGGCLDPDGGAQMVGSHRCNDGRHLWQVDASTGAPAGWGFGDGKFTAVKDAASDPGYSKAYNACKS